MDSRGAAKTELYRVTIIGNKRLIDELALYGPAGSARALSLGESFAYCRGLAQGHYENFTVVSRLVPRRLRQHFCNIYAYCRWADDLADETGDPRRSLELLDWWESQLRDCYAGKTSHPVFTALAETIHSFQIPLEPFADLLTAFRQDQQTTRYRTLDELLGYCRRSADPVGRLILCLADCRDERSYKLSDSICTGLQLANFWQDVAGDWERGRIYLPGQWLERFGYEETMFARRECNAAFRRMMAAAVDDAETRLLAGRPLVAIVPRDFRVAVDLFLHGGLAVLDAIRRLDYDVWSRRPVVTRRQKTALMIGAYWRASVNTPAITGGRTFLSVDTLQADSHNRRPIAESYDACRRMASRSGSNFYPSFLLLPREKQRAMHALYAFMRHTDDLGDNDSPLEKRREALRLWRNNLEAALEAANSNLPDTSELILPALADTVRRFGIPVRHLFDVIEGVEMDLEPAGYETFDDLAEYCRRVASAVGLACIRIWGCDGSPAALAAADSCGLALQLTNIVRDMKEDADAGRIYIPSADFREAGYTVEELRRGAAGPGFERLVQLECEHAEALYREGAALYDHLSPDGRRVFGMIMSVYHRLLQNVRRAGPKILSARTRLPRHEKFCIAARWLIFRPRRLVLHAR